MTPYVECTFNKNTMGMVCLIIMTNNIWCVLCLLNYSHSHVSNVNVLGENLYVVYCGCEKVENRGNFFFWICHFLVHNFHHIFTIFFHPMIKLAWSMLWIPVYSTSSKADIRNRISWQMSIMGFNCTANRVTPAYFKVCYDQSTWTIFL